MIPSVTPFFNPDQITKPILASASAALAHSPVMTILPLLPYLPYILFCISIALLAFATYIFFLSITHYLRKPKVILELKPPYDTRQTAFATEQVVTTLHALGLQTSWWHCFLGDSRE